MASRRQWHLSFLSAVVGAALLAACGGGDSGPTITRVVSFGGSESDLGAYTPATQIPLGQAAGIPPFFGGKFTTNTYTGYSAASNTSTANIWVEWVAARAGVAITPAEVGAFGQSVKCPAAANPALAGSCTGYGQAGARITDPNGIGKPLALTVPIVTQVANHLARFGGFGDGDIVFVYGGYNDIFIQFGSVAQGLPPATAIANVHQAATELAALIKDQILANGARRVATMTVYDLTQSPDYRGLPADSKALLAQIVAEYNNTVRSALAGVDVQIIDAFAFFADMVANPSKYGMTNVTDAACDPAKIAAITGGQITTGSSLFCNASPASAFAAPVPNLNGLKTGASATTWMFADGVHPTTGSYKAFSDYVIAQLKNFGWMPVNQ